MDIIVTLFEFIVDEKRMWQLQYAKFVLKWLSFIMNYLSIGSNVCTLVNIDEVDHCVNE